ncbi:hypothetical protein L218DRAFT_1003054 [Marasmius fiardii PR-910]|nr:hypothetical protein L218DRAFT_1003054 [Marasmius fiardii PR-910]
MLTHLVSVLEQLYLVHRYWIMCVNFPNLDSEWSPEQDFSSVLGIKSSYHSSSSELLFMLVIRNSTVRFTRSSLTFLFRQPAFAFVSSIYVLIIPQSTLQSVYNFNFGTTSVTIAAVVCAATDILIAISMFRAIRKLDTIQDSTQSLLYRLSILAISSGALTATATIIKIILLFVFIQGFAFVFNLIGRIYTLTIVINCIALKRHKHITAAFASGSETQTSIRTSRSPGSVVSTPLR